MLSKALLTILNLPGIGPSFIMKNRISISEGVSSEQEILEVLSGTTKSDFSNTEISFAKERAQGIIDNAEDNGIKIINFNDPLYPNQLLESNRYPLIYVKGEYNSRKQICGIIGSRDCTEVGQKIAKKIARSFQEYKYSILNGLASGIDQATYRDEVNLENIIGVLPGGLAFEKENTLSKDYLEQAKIIERSGGVLISSFEPATKQDNYKLAEYCKLQANLSNILILVQSKMDGGSRFTVEEFSKLQRNLGVINGSHFESDQKNYEANSVILKNPIKGLEDFTGVNSKRQKCKVIEISSKSDYGNLRNISASQQSTLDW